MNRNFAKISVVIVALMLVLAFCLTACKADDVAADLDTTKNEVSANKADAAKALEEATKALEAKIAANEADCAAEIAAVNAAIKAAKDAGAATEASLAAAEKALNDAIDAVRASLDNAKKELSDKITANDAKINAEVAALNAAIENAEAALEAADAADKAALETSLAAAKAELEAAVALLKADVEKLTEYVNSAVAGLKADIAAEKKDLTGSIVALQNALELAKGEAADADAALKAELEQAIAEATKAVVDVVNIADGLLQNQIDTNAADIEAAQIAIENAEAAIDLINSTLEELKGVDAGLIERVAVLEAIIAGYQNTTEAVVKAWHEITATYNNWVELGELYAASADLKTTVKTAYETAQILLYRAFTAEEVNTIKKDFYDVVNAAMNSANEGHKAAYDKLVAAEEELAKDNTDLAAVRVLLDEVRAYLATVGENDAIIVDGAVVDLSDKYDAACKVYNAERIDVLNATINEIKDSIAAAQDNTAAEANDALITSVKAVIDEYTNDADIPFTAEEEAAFAAAHIDLLKLVANRIVDITEATVKGSTEADVDNNARLAKAQLLKVANIRIKAINNLGGDTTELAARVVEVRAEIVKTYLALANAAITEATDAARLEAAEALISTGASKISDVKDDATAEALQALVEEARVAVVEKYIALADAVIAAETLDEQAALDFLAAALASIDNVTVDANKVALKAKYDNSRCAIVSKYIGFANAGIAAAEKLEDLVDDWATIELVDARIETLVADSIDATAVVAARDALVAAYYAKYVDIYAANLTAQMNAYIDNLGAIYAEVVAETTNIADIRNDYVAFVDNRNYTAALHSDSEAVKALAVAEAAFVKVEEQLADLTVLVAEAKDVANILTNDAFATIEGVNAEYVVLVNYKTTADAWVARLDNLGFTVEANAETYNTIRALINEAKYNEIKAAFDDKIAPLVEIAESLIGKIDAIKNDVAENGHKFQTIEAIKDAWAAYRTWEQNATDADGVGFIIAYVSGGKYTNENINTVLVTIETEYYAYVEGAQFTWGAFYNAQAQALIEGTATLKYDETNLSGIRTWFSTYGVVTVEYAEQYNLGNIGTADIEAKLAELEAQLAVLKAERAALVAELKAEADALQARLDNDFANITTDSADMIDQWMDDYDTFARKCEANNVTVTLDDMSALDSARDTLKGLTIQATDVKVLIAKLQIPTMGTDPAAPYFADAAAKDAYVAEVANIKAALAAFEEANDGFRGCISDEEFAKLEAANPELYVAKYEAALAVYDEYVKACNGVENEAVLESLAKYLEEARAEIDAVGSVSTFSLRNDYAAAFAAICEFHAAKSDAVVAVYNAYVEALVDVNNQTVLDKLEAILVAGIAELDEVDADAGYADQLAQIVHLYELKSETTAIVYYAYVRACANLDNNTVLAQVNAYLNEALNEIYNSNETTTNYIAYITQIGTNAESKFIDIKAEAGIDTPTCEQHTYTDACDAYCDVCGARRKAPHVYDNACDVDCNLCEEIRKVPGHVYDNGCDTNCNVCWFGREVPAHADTDADGKCDECALVKGSIAEWPLEFGNGWFTTGEFVQGTSLADPGINRYYYTHTVEKDGLLIINTRDAAIVIFVNGMVQLDENYDPLTTVEVKAGDIVELNVENAAFTLDAVSFQAEIALPGTQNNPFALVEGGTKTPEFVAGTSLADPGIKTYIYKGVSEVDGTLAVVTDNAAIVIFVNGMVQLDENYDPLTKVQVKVGDVVELNVENAAWELFSVSFEATYTEHAYTNVCDADCNNCGALREVEGHKYDNACDAVCNNCTETREVEDHKYDNACDTSCNVCGATRTITHVDANEDYKCDVCSTKMLPAADEALTIPQALAVAKVAGTSYTTQKYYITGTITNVYNTQYGNMYIEDEDGNEICIYGLYSADGKTRYDAMSYKPVVGDEVTVYTVLGMYDTTCQGKNAWLDEVIAHEHDYTDKVTEPTCTKEGYTTHTCTICNGYYTDSETDALGHTTEDGECERCGLTIGANIVNKETFTADFNTVTSTNSSYVTSTTTSGWKATNCAIMGGGTSDANPKFKVFGDAATRAFTMNGKTSAKGTIVSPTLTGGISAISFNYTNCFSESNGVDITITIKQNGVAVATKKLDNNSVTKLTAYTFTWDLEAEGVAVTGDFTIEFTNNSPSNNTGNKDRVSIWNVEWTNNPV